MEIRKVLAILGAMLLVYFLFIRNDKAERTTMDDLEELDMKLTGRVMAVHQLESSNGFGVVNVEVIHSNVKEYDPRGKYDYYYCIIKNNKAQFYQHGTYGVCEEGDTIEVNVKKREFIVRSRAQKTDIGIILYDNARYFRRIEKKYQDF